MTVSCLFAVLCIFGVIAWTVFILLFSLWLREDQASVLPAALNLSLHFQTDRLLLGTMVL
jgi:hypothetical protein